MTDQSANTHPPGTQENQTRRKGRGRAAFFVLLIALAAGLTGAFATSAISGHGFGPGGWHGRGFMTGQMNPAQIEDRADRMVRHLAIEIDATGEQQERLRAVVKSAVRDLVPMRDKVQEARLRGRELLTQSNLDPAAIEAFRVEQMAQADAFSRRVARALTDAGAILTADQRRRLGDLLRPNPGYWRGWHRR